MKAIAPALAALALTFSASPASAFSWSYFGDSKELVGTTGEEEGDTDFRATCKGGGKAEVGIGAAEGIGKGEGEAVSVTLTAGTTLLEVDGKSEKSPNFEMTAGVELQTTVDSSHPIFALLGAKGAIKMFGLDDKIKATWPEKGRAAATKAFLKACFGK